MVIRRKPSSWRHPARTDACEVRYSVARWILEETLIIGLAASGTLYRMLSN